MCFINSHLKAGEGPECKNARIEQIYKIQKSLDGLRGCDYRDAGFERVSDRVDVCFFTGDLNTRLHGISRESTFDLIACTIKSGLFMTVEFQIFQSLFRFI